MKIFINYRRDDDPGFVQAIYSRLLLVFPSEDIFIDVEGLADGEDFVVSLQEQVAQCDVLLAVIGKNWLRIPDAHGRRRLDNQNDFVRLEIEAALKQGKRTIPVLLQHATMPMVDELPKALRPLAGRNARSITHARFKADVEGLIKAIRTPLKQNRVPIHNGGEQEGATGASNQNAGKQGKAAQVPKANPKSPRRPVVMLLTGDDHRVGTTTICQTLIDFIQANTIAVRAFDAGNSLHEFFPDQTKIVDITSVADQISILDTLKGGEATLIDLPTGLMLQTLRTLQKIGFLDACDAGQVKLLNFYVYGPTLTNMPTYAEIQKLTAKSDFFLVQNTLNPAQVLATNPKPDMIVPALDEMSMRASKSAKVSFLRFVANKTQDDRPADYSFVLRGYTRHWLANVWAEYDRLVINRVLDASS